MAFYLKYRPQTIGELDLDYVREQLGKTLSASSIPHAFLFSGPKGLGKTSAARIVAKAINCEAKGQNLKAKSQVEPCNKCEACKSITNATALDLIEIDAASNRGIDDIRELKDKIKLSPSSLKYKVYVIDEVHMLTKEAFNALLKTLEEPPKHAFFVLATTEPEKIPDTIISRCVQIKFRKATTQELRRSLSRIVKREKLQIDDKALQAIAESSEGSFRDGSKILEQLSLSGEKIKIQDVSEYVKQNSKFDLQYWLSAVLEKELKRSLQMMEKGVNEGTDLKWLVVESLKKLQRFLLYKYTAVQPEDEGEKHWFESLDSLEMGTERIVILMKLLDTAGVQVKNALIPHLPLQLAIIDYKVKTENLNAKDSRQSFKIPPLDRNLADQNQGFKDLEMKADSKKPEQEEVTRLGRPKRIKTKFKDIEKNWERFLKALRPENGSVEALLRSSRPKKIDGDMLVIEAFYSFHYEKLQNGRCPTVIQKVLKDIFNEEIRVKCVLGEKKPAAIDKTAEKNIINEAEEIFA